jgi:hypothetical protein
MVAPTCVSITEAQQRFAADHGATPGIRAAWSDGSVFFYREAEHGVERWLVDCDGHIRDLAWFRDRH